MADNTSVDLARVPGDNPVQVSPDLLRAMVQAFAEALMGADADALCRAPYGQPSADRVNYRNGWRERLSEQLFRDLKAWNDSWGSGNPPVAGDVGRVLRERGRELGSGCRTSWAPMTGKCSTSWAGGCTGCIRRAAGPPKHGSRTFLATRPQIRGRRPRKSSGSSNGSGKTSRRLATRIQTRGS